MDQGTNFMLQGALHSITHPSNLYFTVPSTDRWFSGTFNKTLKSLLKKLLKRRVMIGICCCHTYYLHTIKPLKPPQRPLSCYMVGKFEAHLKW